MHHHGPPAAGGPQAARLADFKLVLATKGDGTAWTSGFRVDPETDDAESLPFPGLY